MNLVQRLFTLSPTTWLFLLGNVASILIFASVVSHRWADSSASPLAPRRIAGFVVRFSLIGMATVFLSISGLVIVKTIHSIYVDTAPARSEVKIPKDLSFAVEDITFPGGDGQKMAAWFAPSQNGVTIILLHGYDGDRLSMRWHAEQLTGAGYGVLLVDERASGQSEGKRRSLGWEDAPDVGRAIAYLASRKESATDKVGIVGCSIGGQIALQAAARYPEIGAVWAEGASLLTSRDEPSHQRKIGPRTALSKFRSEVFAMVLGMPVPPAIIDIIGKIAPRPILLVAAGADNEESNMEFYARYAGDNAQVWIIPEAYHCEGSKARPAEYASRMIDFFDTALLKP
jgi:alpha-beta hydrolase superfamily lysophospholipase